MLSNYIGDKVEEHRKTSENLEYKVKNLFFTYLLQKKPLREFSSKIDKYMENLKKSENEKILREYEYIRNIVSKTNKELDEKFSKLTFKSEDNSKLLYEIDTKTIPQARDTYMKVIKNYYDTSLKTVQKEYINEKEYLSSKVSKYDKVEKTVPYYKKNTNEVIGYHSLSSYTSMVMNTNLTRTGWNQTIKDMDTLGNDLVYVVAHPYSCPMCMKWQGKVYSLSGKDKRYDKYETATKGGLGHPNCKHNITGYWSEEQLQDETYTGPEWEEKYDNSQKINGINRKIASLRNDKDIYKKLGNQEQVDKVNQKLKTLYAERRELNG